MGIAVAKSVHGRLGKSILELGGNNALVVSKSADLDMAARSIFFGAVGTAGQRCTSTRRVIAHESVADKLRDQLLRAYESMRIGNPLDRSTTRRSAGRCSCGRCSAGIDREGKGRGRRDSVWRRKTERRRIHRRRLHATGDRARPAGRRDRKARDVWATALHDDLQRLRRGARDSQRCAAGPQFSDLHQRHARSGGVPVSAVGSDCGIANVNAGTSGAEIGGAFGGEKETGGGRESGSDAGRPTCAGRRTRSISRPSCRWPRASASATTPGARRPKQVSRRTPTSR